MSLNREHSRDKTEWVKWPHLETHSQPQLYESPLRASKKLGDNSRSHSWWWASHISPKSSKWLQENLAEMDSKVNAMLKIIEEDADSFSKRAEMYYKRRPELVNLVEEFYRTYRALVERHTCLTKELRQNVAPALQAQLSGADHESPSTFPCDPLVRHRSDGFDIASLSSCPFPGALEFEDDSQSEFSAKFSKGHVDEEDTSPLSSRVSFDTCDFGVGQSFASSSEEEHLLPQHQRRPLDGFEDTNSSNEWSKTVQILEDEKKVLTAKVGEDEVKLKDLQSKVSRLLSQTKALESEEKLAKNRLNEALQLKQTLEAENLKLSHALITCKEEKTQSNEARDRSLREMIASGERIRELEKEVTLLQQKTTASRAEVKRFEDETKKLQHSLTATQERNQREAVALKETFEKRLEGLHRQIIDLEEENGDLKEQSITRRVKLEELKQQLNEVDAIKLQLEQDLLKTQALKEALELNNSTMALRIQELGRELEATQENKQAAEGMLVKANLEVKEIRSSLNAMSSEKILLLQKASSEVGASQREMDGLLQEPVLQTTHFRDVEAALARLLLENDTLQKREAKALLSFSELEKVSQVQVTKLQQTLDEHLALIAQRDVSLTALIKQKNFLEKQGKEALQSNSRLEEEISLLKTERVEASSLAERLCAEVEELKNAKDHAFAKCQQYEEEHKALKAAEEGLKALFLAKVAESLSFQNDKSVIESELAKLCLEMEELQKHMSALSSEKAALKLELEAAQEQMRITNAKGLQWQAKSEDSQSEIQVLQNEVITKMELISKLENETISQRMKITKLEEKIVLLVNEKENDTRTLAKYENKGRDLEARVSESLVAQAALNEQVALKSLGIKSLEVGLAGMRKEKDILSEKFAVCSAHAMLLQNKLDKCKELETLQHADLQKRADTLRSMEMELKNLRLAFSEAEERNSVLISEQRNSLDEISCMHRKIQNLEEQARCLVEDKVLLVKDHEEQKEKLQLQLESSNNMIHCMEAELLKLHKAVCPTEEANASPVFQQSRGIEAGLIQKADFPTEEAHLNPVSEQSRSLDAVLIMPADSITRIHHKVGSLLEERALLVSKASQHKAERDEMESRLQSLERAKDALQDELKKEHQAVFEARRDIENLEGDLNQLRQENAKVENELSTKTIELSSEQEEAWKARTRNNLLEDEARQHHHKIENLTEDVERLGDQLQDAQQEVDGLKEHLSLSAVKCSDAEKATCQAKQEVSKEIENGVLLRHQISNLLTNVSKLEQDVTSAEEDKRILFSKMEALQRELEGAQSEREKLIVQMTERVAKLEDKDAEIKSLQEQVKVADSGQLCSTRNFSESKNQWAAEQVSLQEELAQLKAAIMEGQMNLDVQLESANKLKAELLHMQQENSRLEEHLSQAVSKHMDAERATLDAKEELNKETKSRDLLSSEMAVVLLNLRKLECDLAGVQGEKQALSGHLESLKLEVIRAQDENEDLMSQVKAIMLQLQGKDSELRKLQEQLQAAESQNCSQAEALSNMKISWGSEQERLQGELAQLKATNSEAQKDLAIQLVCVSKLEDELSGLHGEQSLLQGELAQLKATNLGAQKDLAIQLDCVGKLKNELAGLHGERSLLQENGDIHAKKLAEQLDQIEDGRKREHKIGAELLELSALAETLKQSLLARDSENSKLREELSRAAECQSASETKFLDEISFLQGEEMKWRNEVTTNSALMAEKVACLRRENAALHEDLSWKLELLLKLEKDVESLKEERSSLSQALQAMAAEMQEYKNDLQMYKEFVIPSLEERVGELQDEITDLATSNERHVAEIVSLREQLQDATDEITCLYDENAMLKIELIFNVEMLKHVDGVLLASKAENLQLFEALGLQREHSQVQEQHLVETSSEIEGLSRRLLAVTEERNGLKAEVQSLLDALGLQRKHSQVQEQHLVEASSENEGLSRSLVAAMEERNGLKAEMQSLLAVLVEVEQLQKELVASRQDNGVVRAAEPSSMQTVASGIFNNDRGTLFGDDSFQAHMQNTQNIPTNAESVKAEMQHTELDHGKITFSPLAGLKDVGEIDLGAAKESSDGRLKASALLIGMLKEEVFYLQEEIRRLQSATAGQGSGFATEKFGARDFMPGPQEDLPSQSSTASSLSILSVEEAQGSLDDVQRLKEENCSLVQEINSLKSQSLAAWMENNLIENSVKDLQAKLALLQEQNESLCSEVSSCKEQIGRLEEDCHLSQKKNAFLGLEVSTCKAEIDRLGGECHSLQDENAELQENVKASMQEKRKSEEVMRRLEDVITSLERDNRCLHVENESASMAVKHLSNIVSCLHEDGAELIVLIKTKLMAALEEVKLVIEECGKEAGDESIVQIMKDFEDLYSLPQGHLDASIPEDAPENEQGRAMEIGDQGTAQEAITELEAQNMVILNELQARASETNILLEFVVFIRKILIRLLGNANTCQPNALLSATDGNLEVEEVDEHHIKLAERLHQAFVDERLEQELLDLKEGRKQLKEELEVRLVEVQQMESVLEQFQVLLEQDEHGKGERLERGEEQRRKNMWAEESAKELREMLAQQRRQLGRMQEEVMSGEEQQEAAAENQVTVLVRMESVPSMEGWDLEQVNLLSRQLESLRGLNRRHSAELRTISQDLQSMGSIIKEAQDQLLLGGSAQDVEEEIISTADLRTRKSSIIDLRAAESRVSVDSTQQLLSPSPGLVGADSVAARRTRSDGSIGQFTLKPRNFGFEWFLLLFSPDRKAAGLARSKSNKPWAALRPIRRGSSGSSALMVDRGRSKTASCWACVASTSRLDSFDGR